MCSERRWVIWRCDSCRVPVVRGWVYLLADRTWHARHPVKCHPKDHERATVAALAVSQIQWTDQFQWWLTAIEQTGVIDMFATDWLAFLDEWVSIPPGWRPVRVDLGQALPVGITAGAAA